MGITHCPRASCGVYAVGDGGGFIDPLTGEGVGYALETGKAAAEAIGLESDGVTGEAGYASAVRPIVEDLRAASRARNLLVGHPWVLDRLIRRAARSPWLNERLGATLAHAFPMRELLRLGFLLRPLP